MTCLHVHAQECMREWGACAQVSQQTLCTGCAAPCAQSTGHSACRLVWEALRARLSNRLSVRRAVSAVCTFKPPTTFTFNTGGHLMLPPWGSHQGPAPRAACLQSQRRLQVWASGRVCCAELAGCRAGPLNSRWPRFSLQGGLLIHFIYGPLETACMAYLQCKQGTQCSTS
jgi:hypothetical protein